jgi:hypothetical protein
MKPETSIKFLEKVQEIWDCDALSSGNLSFLTRIIVQVTLPHRDPRGAITWGRSNGDFNLTIQPYIYPKNGKEINIGIPYGTIPRLLFAYISTEAVIKKDPCISLGNSLSSFMHSLGMMPTGGRWGSITRLRQQTTKLFTCRIAFSYDGGNTFAFKPHEITDEYVLWWDTKSPDQLTLQDSHIILNQKFFEEIINHPVPVDMRVLKALKQSPMALDLYTWLTYRVSYLKQPVKIPWDGLAGQFGADFQRLRDFRRNVRNNLVKIKTIWQDLKIDENGDDYFTLHPCRSHVSHKVVIPVPSITEKK